MSTPLRFAIVRSRFNEEITQGLLKGATDYLREKGLTEKDWDNFEAPGAFEAPLIAKRLAQTRKYAAVICLGCLIKGDTAHFEYISLGATVGIMNTMLETNTPIGFGIITVYDEAQAHTRAQANVHNKGREAAAACFETLQTLERIGRA